jgi:hypothetical protein
LLSMGAFADPDGVRVMIVLLAVECFFLASFLVWRDEYRRHAEDPLLDVLTSDMHLRGDLGTQLRIWFRKEWRFKASSSHWLGIIAQSRSDGAA